VLNLIKFNLKFRQGRKGLSLLLWVTRTGSITRVTLKYLKRARQHANLGIPAKISICVFRSSEKHKYQILAHENLNVAFIIWEKLLIDRISFIIMAV